MSILLTDFKPTPAAGPDPMKVPEGARAGSNTAPPLPGQGAPLITEADAIKGGEGAKINLLSGGPNPGGPAGTGTGGNQVGLGSLISGKDALKMIDSVFPAILVVAFRYMKLTIKKTDLQLTAAEENTLAPLVQKCMDALMINFDSPFTALAVTAGMIYGAKIIQYGSIAKMDSKKEAEKETPARIIKMDQPAAATSGSADIVQQTEQPAIAPYTEEHIKEVRQKKKKNRADAVAWLEKFWVKKGGVIS